jgi:rhodanese-related sulfurtransferase
MARKKEKPQVKSSNNRPILAIGLVVLLLVGMSGMFMFMQDSQAATNALPREVTAAFTYEKWQAQTAGTSGNAGTYLLDVRTPQEWEEYRIPGIPLIPLNELSARLDEIPQDQEIFIVCRSGNRSATARDILLSAGFENVTSMGGGMLQWQAAGYPTVSGK